MHYLTIYILSMSKTKWNLHVLGALATFLLGSFSFLMLSSTPVEAAVFTEFSIRASRMEVGITDVNFLIKANAVSAAVEDEVRVQFHPQFVVDGTPANITTSTVDVALWDSECTNAWTGIGAAATAVSGNTITFASGNLTAGQTYCFIITAGVDNPASTGNRWVRVATLASSAEVDFGRMSIPIVADDEVVITAAVSSFVRCEVSTTAGADNAIDLEELIYGTVTSSSTLLTPDNILIEGGTNAPEGMVWFYRSDAPNNGLYSGTALALLDGANAELTLNATTTTCAPATPCFGIYYNGVTSAVTGAFTAAPEFTGGTATTDVGPLTTSIYGTAIGNSGGAVGSQITAQFNVNATAAEDSPAAVDYTETLIFTCKADV